MRPVPFSADKYQLCSYLYSPHVDRKLTTDLFCLKSKSWSGKSKKDTVDRVGLCSNLMDQGTWEALTSCTITVVLPWLEKQKVDYEKV